MRMDLENIVEKARQLNWFSFTALKFLAMMFPDWEKSGRKEELAREENEAIEDLKHMDLKWAKRIREISHRWVVSHRRRVHGGVRIIPIGHDPIDEPSERHAEMRAHRIQQHTEAFSERFQKRLERMQERSKLRLVQRRRTRRASEKNRISKDCEQTEDGGVVNLVLEEHVDFAALGLKLRFERERLYVYDVTPGSVADRHGLAKGCILDSAADKLIRDETWVTKKLFHETRPLRLVFLRSA